MNNSDELKTTYFFNVFYLYKLHRDVVDHTNIPHAYYLFIPKKNQELTVRVHFYKYAQNKYLESFHYIELVFNYIYEEYFKDTRTGEIDIQDGDRILEELGIQDYEKQFSRFPNLTMNARMCYIFMCIERYLLTLYPDRNWKPVAKRMWNWTTSCWTDSDILDAYIEMEPDCVLEYESYEGYLNDDGHTMTEDEYKEFLALYNGITTGCESDEICIVLDIPRNLWTGCDGDYYDIEKGKVTAIECIDWIELILKKHSIPLPDESLLSELTAENTDPDKSKFYYYDVNRTDNDQWGFGVNTEYLSVILN